MVRVIPRLDIKGQNLVKGVHLEGLRVLGLPERFSEAYYLSGADELLYMDVVASLYGRNSLEELVRRTAEHVFIPITVGGGIRSVDDARRLLRAGADKVAINTAATKNPGLVTEIAETFGSQCMVLAVEAIRSGNRWLAFTDNGREPTGLDAVEWIRKAVDLGAGEILLTSVDREGTGKGFDIELVNAACEAVDVPVIAHGGAGSRRDFAKLFADTGASAASAASVFHYKQVEELGAEKREEGNIDYLKQFVSGNRSVFDIFQVDTVAGVKEELARTDVECVQSAHCGQNGSLSEARPAKAAPRVAVPEYGRGNLFSVENALRRVGAEVTVTADPDELMGADKIVLAGVGSFHDAMAELDRKGLSQALRELASRGTPILGICLGMQLFFETGYEFGEHPGLGLLGGQVVRLEPGQGPERVRIPHIGWNQALIDPDTAGNGSGKALLKGVESGDFFYFVHSYVVVPTREGDIGARTVYGPNRFCSMVLRDNVTGCQFHPERSGERGLKIYRNWINA